MIVPGGIDPEVASDDEIIGAYAEMGFDEDYARFAVDVIRGRIDPVD